MMPPADTVRAAADLMTQRAEAATGGRWRVGDNQNVAGVNGSFGEGKCAYCDNGEPLTWSGVRDINGHRMQSHVHTSDEAWWDHGIYAHRDDGHLSVVNDTDEYGYMEDADAEHVAHSDPAVMLAVAEWLRASADHADARHCPCDDAALAVATTYLRTGGDS